MIFGEQSCSVASLHTILVAVQNTGGQRKYFNAHVDKDKNSSRIWQVYVKPEI